MQPMDPELRDRVLMENADASETELDEYEWLVAQRYETDPRLSEGPAPLAAAVETALTIDSRVADLWQKLFEPLDK